MLKSKKYLVFVMLCTIFSSCMMADMQPEQSDTSAIKPDCKTEVDPNGNPLEQLLDYYYENGGKYNFWVSTPNRAVPLISISTEDGKVTYLQFKIPHRIDMDEKYSNQIDEAVKTRPELPFAAYHFVRNVPQDETVDIKLDNWMLYNLRMANAGKHGKYMCYNMEPDSDKDCGCFPIEEFEEYLKFYKPNKK